MYSKLIAAALVGTASAGMGGGKDGGKGDDGVGECQSEWVLNTACAYSGRFPVTGECVAGNVLTAPMMYPPPPGAPGRHLRVPEKKKKGPPPLTADECLALCEAENEDGCCEYLAPKGPPSSRGRHTRTAPKPKKKGPPQCVFYPGNDVDFMGEQGAALGKKHGGPPPYQSVVCGKKKAPKNGYVGPKNKGKKKGDDTLDPCPKKYAGPFDRHPGCDECAGRVPAPLLSASAVGGTASASSTVVIGAMAGTVVLVGALVVARRMRARSAAFAAAEENIAEQLEWDDEKVEASVSEI